MKNKILLLIFSIYLFSGCSALKKFVHKENKIDKTSTALEATKNDKLHEIGKMSLATDYALDNTNIPAAKTTNSRVIALADKPSLDEANQMRLLVSELLTNNNKALVIEDKRISGLENTVINLQDKLQKQTEAQLKAGEKNTAELAQYTGWFGLKAVWMGLKRFSLWLIGFVVLFLILRIAAMFNPIAGSIFSIFDGIGGIAIHGIKALAPKAVATAGLVEQSSANALNKIVDTIETAKQTQDAGGKQINLQDLLTQLEKNMGDTDKKVIDTAKKSLGYT